jgi:hypothetical protein
MSKHFEDDMPSTITNGFRLGELQMITAGTGVGKTVTRNQEIAELIEELWTSDEASALTNRAARMIETLYRELNSAERELDRHGL